MQKSDVIIIGAGAAGLMCAIEAGKRGRKVTIIEHSNKPGKKILMSGGGRCNFTNYYASPENYISHNPHFCKSALSQFTQWDFIRLVEEYNIEYYEKTKGQLFCKNKSRDILNLLLEECAKYNINLNTQTEVLSIDYIKDNSYKIKTSKIEYHCESLVIATGGLSIPTMGASPFGYKVAEQFNLKVFKPRAGLVPVTLDKNLKQILEPLSGVAVNSEVTCSNTSFKESLLFTHRGLSGPSILQISSYFNISDVITINLLPDNSLIDILHAEKINNHDKQLKTILAKYFPKNLIKIFLGFISDTISEKLIKQLDHKEILEVNNIFCHWQVKPVGTEGYRTAEVTLGGIDVNQISSKTMEVNNIKGLYFVGEVLDVTGWLGGYNFQWAWSSGWVAGQYA